MTEIRTKTLEQIFETKFSRAGQVLNEANIKPEISSYEVVSFESNLPEPDLVVRDVESDFAPKYDAMQFTSPGMRDMAEKDTQLLQRWLKNPVGKRVLEIGPGTGRITLPLAEAVGPFGKIYAVETAKPYLTKLIQKASAAGVDPKRLGLAVADMQTISQKDLKKLLEGEDVDLAALWFGPLALMTTDPQAVLDKTASVLKTGGEVVLTTNSLDGLSYRIPEKGDLGYKPSIFTRRYFVDKKSRTPSGMILSTDQVLPAIFYNLETLNPLMEKAGLKITGVQGTTRLTGIFPNNPSETDSLNKYIDIVSEIEPDAAEVMRKSQGDPDAVWRVAEGSDKAYCQDPSRLGEYTYLGIKAEKI